MFKIYQSGEHIPGFDGVIRGGTTITVDDPLDIRGPQALSSQPLSDKNPLEAMRNFLTAPFIDLSTWFYPNSNRYLGIYNLTFPN